jgi:hypothetical protein
MSGARPNYYYSDPSIGAAVGNLGTAIWGDPSRPLRAAQGDYYNAQAERQRGQEQRDRDRAAARTRVSALIPGLTTRTNPDGTITRLSPDEIRNNILARGIAGGLEGYDPNELGQVFRTIGAFSGDEGLGRAGMAAAGGNPTVTTAIVPQTGIDYQNRDIAGNVRVAGVQAGATVAAARIRDQGETTRQATDLAARAAAARNGDLILSPGQEATITPGRAAALNVQPPPGMAPGEPVPPAVVRGARQPVSETQARGALLEGVFNGTTPVPEGLTMPDLVAPSVVTQRERNASNERTATIRAAATRAGATPAAQQAYIDDARTPEERSARIQEIALMPRTIAQDRNNTQVRVAEIRTAGGVLQATISADGRVEVARKNNAGALERVELRNLTETEIAQIAAQSGVDRATLQAQAAIQVGAGNNQTSRANNADTNSTNASIAQGNNATAVTVGQGNNAAAVAVGQGNNLATTDAARIRAQNQPPAELGATEANAISARLAARLGITAQNRDTPAGAVLERVRATLPPEVQTQLATAMQDAWSRTRNVDSVVEAAAGILAGYEYKDPWLGSARLQPRAGAAPQLVPQRTTAPDGRTAPAPAAATTPSAPTAGLPPLTQRVKGTNYTLPNGRTMQWTGTGWIEPPVN